MENIVRHYFIHRRNGFCPANAWAMAMLHADFTPAELARFFAPR